jgi:HSP20 family molecular chaperone IbpA
MIIMRYKEEIKMLKGLFGFDSRFGDDFWHDLWGEQSLVLAGNQIERANIKEDIEKSKDGIKIYYEVPGLSKDNISVTVSDDGILKIEGKRTEEVNNKFISKIKKYGFLKEYDISNGYDKESIGVTLKNGILEVSLKFKEMKIAENKERKIEIKEIT